jgi:RNA ligase (TIGR02306 family)
MSLFECPVVTIKTVEPNPNSDNLDILTFEEVGWVCQDVRGKRMVGQHVVYIPVDAMVDCSRKEFEFLTKQAKMRTVRVPPFFATPEDEAKGEFTVLAQRPIARIRTIRLRGVISQGLVIDPPSKLFVPGLDFAEYLGVTKYEPPQEAVFSADAKGLYPDWCPKTDAERYQNVKTLLEPLLDEEFVMSMKIDGTSLTVFYDSTRKGDEVGVCSRNQELKPPDTVVNGNSREEEKQFGFATNIYWRTAKENGLIWLAYKLSEELGVERVAIQGEIAGEGIQSNPMGMRGRQFFAFDVYVMTGAVGRYLPYDQFLSLMERHEVPTVPVIQRKMTLRLFDMDSVNHLEYPNHSPAEGAVFVGLSDKPLGRFGRLKFKYINPLFLLKKKDRDA